MRRIEYLWFLFGLIGTISGQIEIGGWKPITGPSSGIKTVEAPVLANRVLNTASSSRSSITFNGQTISTNIGDIGTNDATGPILTVDAPDLIGDIENQPRYIGYSGGKILNGFLGATAAVSFNAFSKTKMHDTTKNKLIEQISTIIKKLLKMKNGL